MEPTQDTQPNEAENQVTTSPDAVAPAVPPEPKALDLLKSGWRFAKDRTDLYMWYIVALAILSGFQTVLNQSLQQDIFSLIGIVGIIAGSIAAALLSWTVVYAVAQPDVRQVQFADAFAWTQRNFFGFLWTTFLVTLFIMLGFAALVVPGIILLVYLYFALYAFATGAESGMAAIKESYHTVKGRWWQTALKLLAVGLWIILLYIPITIVTTILFVAIPENLVGYILINVVTSGIIGGVIGVISMYVLAQYYKYLKATR